MTPYAKLYENPSRKGASWQIGEIYAKNVIYTDIPFFFNSTTAQTPRWFFACYGSNNVVWCKDVPFRG